MAPPPCSSALGAPLAPLCDAPAEGGWTRGGDVRSAPRLGDLEKEQKESREKEFRVPDSPALRGRARTMALLALATSLTSAWH